MFTENPTADIALSLFKLFIFVMLAQGFTYLWSEKIWNYYIKSLLPSKDPKFAVDVKRVFAILAMSWGWATYYQDLVELRKGDLITQRGFEFGLAKSSVSWIIGGFFTTLFALNMVWQGHFSIFQYLVQSQANPPEWLYYFSNDEGIGWLVCFIAGYMLSLVFGLIWLVPIVSTVLLGLFLTSVMSSALLIMGGCLGTISRFALHLDYKERQDLFEKFMIMSIATFITAPILKLFLPFISVGGWLESSHWMRWMDLMLALGVLISVETIISSIYFHFRFHRREYLRQKELLRFRPRRSWKR